VYPGQGYLFFHNLNEIEVLPISLSFYTVTWNRQILILKKIQNISLKDFWKSDNLKSISLNDETL